MSQLNHNQFVSHHDGHCIAVEINGKRTLVGSEAAEGLREELVKSASRHRVARMEYQKFICLMSLGHKTQKL